MTTLFADSSVEVQRLPETAVVEQLPQPADLIFGFEKWLFAKDHRVLFIDSILDGPCNTFGRFGDASQMFGHELQVDQDRHVPPQ